MEERKKWFTLAEAAEILRPERDGRPLPQDEAVKWLLDTMLNVYEQTTESMLLPSYVFNQPVEVWDWRDRKNDETEQFSGIVDLWIEGKSPRDHPGLMPGLIDLTPHLRGLSRKHGDYTISLHCPQPEGSQEYPAIRLVESKTVRESELVVFRTRLENYAAELGLDDVLKCLEERDYKSPEGAQDDEQARLEWCIERVDELRKSGMADTEIANQLYDEEDMPWHVIGQAVKRDDVHRSRSGWHRVATRLAGREKSQMKKQ